MTQATSNSVTVKVADLTTREPFVSLFPINPVTRDLIRDDVRENGMRDPILCKRETDTGALVVIDGHTRLDVARELDLEEAPVTDLGTLPDDDAIRRAYGSETQRRKLDPGQIALRVIVNGHERILVPDAKRPSAKAIGAAIGASAITVERARKIAKYNGGEYVERVMSEPSDEEHLSLGAAYRRISAEENRTGDQERRRQEAEQAERDRRQVEETDEEREERRDRRTGRAEAERRVQTETTVLREAEPEPEEAESGTPESAPEPEVEDEDQVEDERVRWDSTTYDALGSFRVATLALAAERLPDSEWLRLARWAISEGQEFIDALTRGDEAKAETAEADEIPDYEDPAPLRARAWPDIGDMLVAKRGKDVANAFVVNLHRKDKQVEVHYADGSGKATVRFADLQRDYHLMRRKLVKVTESDPEPPATHTPVVPPTQFTAPEGKAFGQPRELKGYEAQPGDLLVKVKDDYHGVAPAELLVISGLRNDGKHKVQLPDGTRSLNRVAMMADTYAVRPLVDAVE